MAKKSMLGLRFLPSEGHHIDAILWFESPSHDMVTRFEAIVDGLNIDMMSPEQMAGHFGSGFNRNRIRQVIQQLIDHREGRLMTVETERG